jgi:hypothetical protein
MTAGQPNPEQETTSAWELVQTKPTAELGGAQPTDQGQPATHPMGVLNPTSGISYYKTFAPNFCSKKILICKNYIYYIIE